MAHPRAAPIAFKPPQKPQAWTGVRDALMNGPSAPQDAGDPGGKLIGDAMLMGNTTQSEDCLTLNVLHARHRRQAAGDGVAARRRTYLRLGHRAGL